MTKINFPVKLKDIPKIENMNAIKFNIFGVDDKQSIYPLYTSKTGLSPPPPVFYY